MRRSFRYALLALTLCGAYVVSCAPAATTARPESQRNTVTAADIEQSPDMPIELIIQRKVPGVTAVNVAGVLILQIRGAMDMPSNIKTEASEVRPPLYVVNGMRTPAGSSGEMPSIPVREIQLIKVLKGNDAGLYGIDGSNGVIEITTKGH